MELRRYVRNGVTKMLISAPTVTVTKPNTPTSDGDTVTTSTNSNTTTKWSDFSVSSLCRDIKKTSTKSDEFNSDDAIIVGGLASNWKLDVPTNANFTPASIANPLPIINSVIPGGVQSIAGKILLILLPIKNYFFISAVFYNL